MKHKLTIVAQPGWPPFEEVVFKCLNCQRVMVMDRTTLLLWRKGSNVWTLQFLGPTHYSRVQKWSKCRAGTEPHSSGIESAPTAE